MLPARKEDPLLFAVGGPRGVGKTAVLKYLVSNHNDLSVIFMSDQLRNFSDEQLGKNFFTLTIEEKDRVRMQHGKELMAQLHDRRGIFLLDLHYTEISEGEDKVIQPKVLLQCVGAFALLDADSSIILKRISGQEELGRVRSVVHIEKERNAEILMAKNLAVRYNKPYFPVSGEGSLETVSFGLYELLKSWTGEVAP